MTRSTEAKLRRSSLRRTPHELGRDERGVFIAYCPYPAHRQIVGNGVLKKCLENLNCHYLEFFRREKEIPKEGILVQMLIVPDKKAYLTEIQRQRAEDELIYARELIKEATQRYVQSLVNRDRIFVYDVTGEVLYRQNPTPLKSCPLGEYARREKEAQEKKEKKKRGGIKKPYRK